MLLVCVCEKWCIAMITFSKEFVKRVVTTVILLPVFIGAYLHSTLLYSFLLIALWSLIMIFEWPKLVPTNKLSFFLISCMYPTLPIVSLGLLNYYFRPINFIIPLYPYFVAWMADTGGYFVGKLCGSHKMCPTISPGKTWEGFAGGFCAVFAAHVMIASSLVGIPFSFWTSSVPRVIAVSLFMTTISFLGGFMLSFLKRRQGLKDVGNVLPGHGGLLDRFDSVFFVAPLFLAMGLLAAFLSL
jgi:phosphatidate cytidylyltransferase